MTDRRYCANPNSHAPKNCPDAAGWEGPNFPRRHYRDAADAADVPAAFRGRLIVPADAVNPNDAPDDGLDGIAGDAASAFAITEAGAAILADATARLADGRAATYQVALQQADAARDLCGGGRRRYGPFGPDGSQDSITCEICGRVGSTGEHPCRFEIACSCWRGEPCEVWAAGYNMAGYLPETEPETFASLADAAAYLTETLEAWLDQDEAPADMAAAEILTVDLVAGYADGWYTSPAGGAALHLWAERI